MLATDGRLARQCGFCYELRLHRARGYGALKAILDILGVEATGPSGAPVSWSPDQCSATDIVDGPLACDYDHTSGETFPLGPTNKGHMKGDDYLNHFLLPNFYFHITASYAILRHCGVDLVKKDFFYDSLAVAVTEVGLAFLAVNLVTGSIWARVIWGVWWAWDPRLTSALICWMLYAGYLILRQALEEPRIAAVMEAVSWQRANRLDAVKIIAAKFKVSQSEAERSYDTMTGLLSMDGSVGINKVRGYVNLLREERPISEVVDPEKLVDFSTLPSIRW